MSPYIKLAILYYFTEEPLALSVGTIHGGPCSGSARPKTLLSGWSRPSLVSRPRRLLLASLTGSEGRGKLHPERPASCRRSVVSGDRRLLLASLTGSEGRGKLHPERPASCRRSVVSGDRRLLLASLTGSEGRGKLHPERPASCRRSVVSGDRRLLLASLTGSEGRGKLHGRKRCQRNPRCVVVNVVEYVLCAIPTTACRYAIYRRALHRASVPPCVSRVTSLITTVSTVAL